MEYTHRNSKNEEDILEFTTTYSQCDDDELEPEATTVPFNEIEDSDDIE